MRHNLTVKDNVFHVFTVKDNYKNLRKVKEVLKSRCFSKEQSVVDSLCQQEGRHEVVNGARLTRMGAEREDVQSSVSSDHVHDGKVRVHEVQVVTETR